MTQKEANQKIEEIVDAMLIEERNIAALAKKQGRWMPGLDANNGLFKGLHAETEMKIKEILEQVDEENDGR